MLIAQITDLHLRPNETHQNHERLSRVIGHLSNLNPVPDLLVISGDLANGGEVGSYRALRRALGNWPTRIQLTLGNHDCRDTFLEVFPEAADEDGFAQSSIDLGAGRIIVIDTLEPGRAGGGFCTIRANWLRTELARNPARPTLIVLHHPPTNIGLSWIDPGRRPRWASLLAETIRPFPVVGISAGHVHVGASLAWEAHRLSTCPAVSSDLSLVFAPMDPLAPDGRPLVEQGDPGFALHRWAAGQLYTYFGRCPERVTDRWDASSAQTIVSMMSERED
jgi:3',5'-cyclic AMP phosphodiesterase CpdA